MAEEVELIIAIHHTVQRLLQPATVVIPFASELTRCLPVNRPEARRGFGHLLGLISAVALLYQFQRKRDAAGRIVATLDDYNVVRQHLTEPVARGIGVSLTAGAKTLRAHIEDNYDLEDHFTPADLKESTGLDRVVYDRLKELRQHGWIKIVDAGGGSVPAKYAKTLYPTGAIGLELPELKKVCAGSPLQSCTQIDKFSNDNAL